MMRRRGMFILEVAAATVLLAAVGILLVTSVHARKQLDRRLDARMAAAEAARTALLYRQDGRPQPQVAGVLLETRVLDTSADAGSQWVAIRATAAEEHVELIGLVPVAGSKAGAP